MNKGLKILLAILLGAYILSPVDLLSACPLDDIIILLIAVASNRKLGQATRREVIEKRDTDVIDQYPS
ncbi:hypothetical protein [Butyrivibrio sp. VCD2006]|uniref:hypothetical protein n=1 Tax=Butyrivibrio sp. VCD2006 TaxID=1280664 RepID=UPI0003FE3DED|nr:hypothetical protein [Butyrivibrio sp. VCD2006]